MKLADEVTSKYESEEPAENDERWMQVLKVINDKLDRKPLSERIALQATLIGILTGKFVEAPAGEQKLIKLLKEFRKEQF